MKKLSFLLLFSIITAFSLSATNVSGPITSNTLWSVANSPYVVTGNILVMEGVTLTIQPGVEVRFDASKALQVNGTLIAMGTAADSIRFTSNTTQTPGAWGNIYFPNTSTDVVFDDAGNYLSGCILEYCIVEYGGNIEGTNANMLRLDDALPGIRNCAIKNAANAGIEIHYPHYDTLNYNLSNNCFRHCKLGITALSYLSWIYITNSSFIQNECGIDANALMKIDNNLFSGNSQALSMDSRSVITNNEFSDNETMNPGSSNFIISVRDEVDFTNNLCQRNGSDLIYCFFMDGMGIIKSNIFTDNVCTSGSGSLISVFNDNDNGYCPLFFENNIITNNSRFKPLEVRLAMNVPATFTSNVITNNFTTADLLNVNNLFTGALDTTLITFKDNIITQNFSTSDVLTTFKGKIALNQNSFYDNGPSAFILKNNNSPAFQPYLDVSNNYWGVETVEELSEIIYDFFDDANLGITLHDSILLAPPASNPVLPPANVGKTDLGNNRVQLSWLANSDADIKGYNVYWGNYTGFTFEHMADAGLNTNFIIDGASVDDTIAVTAYDNDYISGNKTKKWLNENMLNGHESAYSFELHFPLGIKEIKETADFSIYPVPACEKITIELKNLNDYSSLSIVNIQGQSLKTIHLTNSKTEVAIEELTRGMYFVVLSGSKGISMKKVIRM
ncbi:MAG: carbohydrate-binding and sugar hydrolysis protein [Bacteroidetes bacterium]|nr:MAG: carbohydrate-binding and sugar hydrolysis protein [Bacteroidota bacterium]